MLAATAAIRRTLKKALPSLKPSTVREETQVRQGRVNGDKARWPRLPRSGRELLRGGWEGRLWKQGTIKRAYETEVVQRTVAFLIVANFVVTIAEKEIDPFDSSLQFHYPVWRAFDTFFTFVFVGELLFNMYGLYLYRFYRSGWNMFDLVIVAISVLNWAGALAGVGFLKTLRAFRVFRLFKRIESLNKIITALMRAIPGMLHALFIMLLVMAIYAVIAVELYSSFAIDGTYITIEQTELTDPARVSTYHNVTASSISMRGMAFGHEYFGTFSRALFSLFQVMTGESWAEMVARPIIFGYAPWNALGGAVFFVTFIVVMQVILLNVVVAVLLDKFVTEDPTPGDDSAWDGVAESDEDEDTTAAKLQDNPNASGWAEAKGGTQMAARQAKEKEAKELAAAVRAAGGGGGGGGAGGGDGAASASTAGGQAAYPPKGGGGGAGQPPQPQPQPQTQRAAASQPKPPQQLPPAARLPPGLAEGETADGQQTASTTMELEMAKLRQAMGQMQSKLDNELAAISRELSKLDGLRALLESQAARSA